MEKGGPYIPRWVKWIGGLLATCLILLVPDRAAELPALAKRQTYVACASPTREVEKPGCSTTVCSHHSIAFVSLRAGFSFVPPVVFLPGLLSAFYHALSIEQPGRLFGSFFFFGMLRSIFEHQIAINAP